MCHSMASPRLSRPSRRVIQAYPLLSIQMRPRFTWFRPVGFDQPASNPHKVSWVMHYVLFYEVGEGYVERRVPYRNEHLALVRKSYDQGDIVLAGALADPADGA